MSKLFLKTFISVFCIFPIFLNNVATFRLKFTNITCTNYDPSFFTIDRCLLNEVSKDVSYMTGKVTLLQVPVTDFKLRVQLMKKSNGWKPFLYDVTIGCNFTKNLNAITTLAWNAVKNVSNINHDCPYNQSLEVERVDNVYFENVFKMLPVPAGEYALLTTWESHNVTRGKADFYVVVY